MASHSTGWSGSARSGNSERGCRPDSSHVMLPKRPSLDRVFSEPQTAASIKPNRSVQWSMNWREVIYKVEERNDPSIRAVVDAICKTYANGGMICRCFRPLNGAAYEHVSRIDPRGDGHWLKSFLESDSVLRCVPEPEIDEPEMEEGIDPFPAYVKYGSYEFEGAITGLLLSDGAYIKSDLNADQARSMAREFVDALLPDSRKYVPVFRVDSKWNDWINMGWGATFVVFNHKQERLWLVCATDTD